MQKTKHKKTVMQWLIPLGALIIAVSIIVVDFAVESRKIIESLYEINNEQVGNSYCENIEGDMAAIAHVSDAMQNILESRADGNVDYLMDTIEAMVNSSAAYMVAYCYDNGKALLPNQESVDIKETSYYEYLKGTANFFIYTKDDGITGQPAFLYICPVQYGGEMDGYLVTYIPPSVFESVFEAAHYKENAFYAIVNRKGEILSTYGYTEETVFLQDDFWDSLKPFTEFPGYWAVFDRQRSEKEIANLSVISGEEKRTIYAFPIKGTEWNFVVGLDDEYVQKSQDTIWQPIMEMIIKIIVSFTVFILVVVGITILFRIRASRHNQELEDKADTDLLTELNNKIATERKIKEYMQENPENQGLLFIVDLDNFKKINDTLGHAFGDEVLRSLGMRFRSMFRMSDIIGRVGGDEFIIFLKDMKDKESIEREGQKLEKFFHQFEVGEYVKYSITASVGGAVFPRDGNSFEHLYKAADIALYTSKNHGKNQVSFYHDEKK